MSSTSRVSKDPKVTVKCMAWNEEATALAIGTAEGFIIYSTEPIVGLQQGQGGRGGGGNINVTSPNFHTHSNNPGNGGFLTEVCSRKVQGGVGHIALFRQSNMILFSGYQDVEDYSSTSVGAIASAVAASQDDLAASRAAGSKGGEGEGKEDDDEENNLNTGAEPSSSVTTAGAAVAPFNCKVTLWNDLLMVDSQGLDSIATAHGLHSGRTRSGVVATLVMPTPVVALRMHSTCMIVAEEAKIHVLGEYLNTLESYETPESFTAGGGGSLLSGGGVVTSSTVGAAGAGGGTGLRGLSINDNSIALATYPKPSKGLGMLLLGATTGTVRCCWLFEETAPEPQSGRFAVASSSQQVFQQPSAPPPSLKTQKIRISGMPTPHQRPIRCLAISADGTKGATISEQGTAIKLIDVLNGVALTQLNRGTTSSAVFTMSFSPGHGEILSCLSDNGTLHFFDVGLNNSHGGKQQQQRGAGGSAGGGMGSGKLSSSSSSSKNHKSTLGALGSAALGYAPSSIAGSKLVTNARAYASSEYSFASFSLSTTGGSTVVDDIENERSDTFSSTFAALAASPLMGKNFQIYAAQGNNEEAVDEDAAGQVVGFSGPRCKLVKIGLDLTTERAERLTTNYFPHEEL